MGKNRTGNKKIEDLAKLIEKVKDEHNASKAFDGESNKPQIPKDRIPDPPPEKED